MLSNGFSAEFGRAMGGVINTVTRSGSNDMHGTAYWYFRNRTLNAMDRYAPKGLNPSEWRHQAGGSLGGPIVKDKLFFFANTEIVKRNFPAINRIINTPVYRCGWKQHYGCLHGHGNSVRHRHRFHQEADGRVVPRTVDSAMGFLKFDYRPTERDSFSFDINAMHWKSPHGIQTQTVLTNGNALGDNGNSTVETRYGKASWISRLQPQASSTNSASVFSRIGFPIRQQAISGPPKPEALDLPNSTASAQPQLIRAPFPVNCATSSRII